MSAILNVSELRKSLCRPVHALDGGRSPSRRPAYRRIGPNGSGKSTRRSDCSRVQKASTRGKVALADTGHHRRRRITRPRRLCAPSDGAHYDARPARQSRNRGQQFDPGGPGSTSYATKG